MMRVGRGGVVGLSSSLWLDRMDSSGTPCSLGAPDSRVQRQRFAIYVRQTTLDDRWVEAL